MATTDTKHRLLKHRLARTGLLDSDNLGMARPVRLEHNGSIPLSSAQKRMWYQAQLADGAAYNFCVVIRADAGNAPEDLTPERLQAALNRLTACHDILRTRYVTSADGIPHQIVDDTLIPGLSVHDLASGDPEAELDLFAQEMRGVPFDLAVEAPLRAVLLRHRARPFAFVLAMPHIAGDGGSFATVLRDLERFLANAGASTGDGTQLRYSDYAVWEQARLQQGDLVRGQLDYWSETLAGMPAGQTQLPYDFPRPENPSFDGQQIRQWLGTGLSVNLRRAAQECGVSALVLMQVAVAAALARADTGEDICLGIPVDLRQDPKLAETVGFFNNTVVVRSDLSGDPTLETLTSRVNTAMLGALDHRDVPFEQVVERINPPRETARNPLFDVMVTTSRPWQVLEFSGCRWQVAEPSQTQAKFDLTFVLHDEGATGRIGLSLLFAPDLFTADTAAELLAMVTAALGQSVYHRGLRLSQLADISATPLSDAALGFLQKIAPAPGSAAVERREIALRPGVNGTRIAAALSRLVSRHPALRLRYDADAGRWRVMDAAELFDVPLFSETGPNGLPHGRFTAWKEGTDRLVLAAPRGCFDSESWAVMLAELSELRCGGSAALPPMPANYDHWLTRTAELAGSDTVLELAEDWLDLLEEAGEARHVPDENRQTVTAEVALPELVDWPDPIALRTVAVASLLPEHMTAWRLDIDEPDRDRLPSSEGFAPLIGNCRRVVPCLIAPPSGDDVQSNAALLRGAKQALCLGRDRATIGEVAASFGLAREFHPEAAGVFDDLPAPRMRLSVRLSDQGDAAEGLADPEDMPADVEMRMLAFCVHRRQVRLSLSAALPRSVAEARFAAWKKRLLALVAHAGTMRISTTRAGMSSGLALSGREQRKLESCFGQLKAAFPLSPLQEGLRFHAVGVSAGQQDVYISQTCLSLSGEIDPERLRHAVSRAAELVPNIAAGFTELGDRMVQVHPYMTKVPFRFDNVAGEDAAREIADAEYRAEFDAAEPPLIRFALVRFAGAGKEREVRNHFYLTAHHILLDGWSIRLLFRLIFRLYAAADMRIVAPPPGFDRYLSWLEKQDSLVAEAAWRDILEGAQPTLLYPAAQGLEANASQSAECEAHIGGSAMAALEELARGASTTLSSVLELAWGTLLIRMSGSGDVVFGNVVLGRPADIEGVDEIIGLMFNTVPARIRVIGGQTVREALTELHRQKAASLRHSHVRLSRLMQISGHSPLFDTLFAVQNLPGLTQEEAGGIRFGEARIRDATHYPLSMAVSPGPDGISLRLMYRRDLIEPAHAEALLSAYQHIAREFVERPERPLMQVDALPERSPLRPGSDAGAELDYGSDSVSDLLVAQARKTPDLVAVVADGVELSFAELSGRANQLAHFLRARGVYPEHRVALLLPRSEVMIVALFGVFAAHAAYVPIDAETPANRVEAILDQSEPTVILTTAALRGVLPESYRSDYRIVQTDAPETEAALALQPRTRPEVCRPAGLDHLAYVIFTSGSTGQPKGVAVPYRGLTNMFVNHQKEIFAPTLAAQGGRRIRIAHTTSFAFDASWEQLLWLLSGHEVHVIGDELRRDPDRLLSLFDRSGIDAFDVTPTYGSYLVQHGLLDRPRPRGEDGATGVVFVSLGGEAVNDALWTRLRDAPGVGGYNLYGPTEYTINALGANLADSAEPSVGRPISNTRAMILGPGLLPAPVGVIGELYLSGAGLARGYMQQPGLTAERFVAHPDGAAGERLYRTGDLARWRIDGSIDFLGRSDGQLKIRGYRIEPAEVESVIAAVEGISRAAVVGQPSDMGGLRLVAYIVGAETGPSIAALRDHLRRELPSFMVPSALVYVDDLPRTINGKLDIGALPLPEAEEAAGGLPATETETRICDAFARVLERPNVGRFDDFFDAGGHSLLTVRLAGQLRESLARDVSVRQIYDNPTPAALGAALDGADSLSSPDTATEIAVDREFAHRLEVAARLPEDLPLPHADAVELTGARPVLLTGAAGFLGCHLLAELLSSFPGQVECLVRAADNNAALKRVRQALLSYGLWQEGFESRILGLAGDLSRQRFGLEAGAFRALADRYEVILHNGGATNEAEPYHRLAPTNVDGAKHVLRLATLGRRATPVHFVSTASVAVRRGRNPAVIDESTRLEADEIEPTGYVQSKWVAEEIMHRAGEAGLPVIIHRPGRVSGHSVSGACGPGVGFWYFIRAMLQLEAAPCLRMDGLTLAPVDYVARAMVALVGRGEPGATYHLTNRSRTSVRDIVEATRRAGYRLEEISFADWLERLRADAEVRAARGDDSLSPALLLTGHMKKYDGLVAESALCQAGLEAALAGTGITPPSITADILDRYVAYFIETGFFPSPSILVT